MLALLAVLQPSTFSHIVGGLIGGVALIAIVVAVLRDRKRRKNGQPWPRWTKQDEAAQARDKLRTWKGE